jgi:hypothetical protein
LSHAQARFSRPRRLTHSLDTLFESTFGGTVERGSPALTCSYECRRGDLNSDPSPIRACQTLRLRVSNTVLTWAFASSSVGSCQEVSEGCKHHCLQTACKLGYRGSSSIPPGNRLPRCHRPPPAGGPHGAGPHGAGMARNSEWCPVHASRHRSGSRRGGVHADHRRVRSGRGDHRRQ